MSEKKSIVVVGCVEKDAAILKCLGFAYDIENIIAPEEYLEEILTAEADGEEGPVIPDFVLFGEHVVVDTKSYMANKKMMGYGELASTTDGLYAASLREIYNNIQRSRPNDCKFIGFGEGAIFLGLLNGCDVIYDVTNHNDTKHLISFCMPDSNILEFEVGSNHDKLLFPKGARDYNILAFSSFNISDSYTSSEGETFKAKQNFVEIEAIDFNESKSICFNYTTPRKDESVLIDLTLQFIKDE